MVYVVFLRGINVGGNRKVDMKLLKDTFEHAGMQNVSTYINSGNVIFQSDSLDSAQLTQTLEKAIATDFGFPVQVLLRNINDMKAVVKALPDTWVNDNTMKCDVIFLWKTADRSNVLKQLNIKPEIDDVTYIPGAILWRVDRSNVTKSGMLKLVGAEIYRQMTIRNCNTTRKLFTLMNSVDPDL